MSQATICGLIALGAIVMMFTKIPRGATATLAVILMILAGITDYSTAFKQYSSSTIAIMLSMMIVGAALFETGMATYMGKFLLKITGTRETGILRTVCYIRFRLCLGYRRLLSLPSHYRRHYGGVGDFLSANIVRLYDRPDDRTIYHPCGRHWESD